MYYVYIPGSYSVLEPVQFDGKQCRGMYSGETLEQLQVHNPKVVMLHHDDCFDAIRKAARMPVEFISKNTFDMFHRSNIMDEYRSERGTTFKCREFIAADIVTCFASLTVNDHTLFATFRDVDSLTHDEILNRVGNVFENTPTVKPGIEY